MLPLVVADTRAILAMLNEQGRLFGFDQDPDADKNALHDARFHLNPPKFQTPKTLFAPLRGKPSWWHLADLGVSWHQLKTPECGFSIHFNDDQLDMRMDKDNEQLLTARKIINTYSADKLTYLFETYGELPVPNALFKPY